MLKQTPLNAAHRAAGAKMVDFGGWDMPLHYGSQLDEHHKVRTDAGMFDVSHMQVVDLAGEGARDFLRQMMANNVDKLTLPGKALYSCMLNEQGGVIDDLIIYFMREDWFRIVVNAGTAEKDLAWMEAQREKLAPQLTLTPRRDLAMIAVQGPNARSQVLGRHARLAGNQRTSQSFSGRGNGHHVHRPHRLHRRRRLRNHGAGQGRAFPVAGIAGAGRCAHRPRRSRHPASGSRHESLRPGHGRNRLPARVRARTGRSISPARATSSASKRSPASP